MTVFESSEFSKWLPILLILVLIITILGLSYWYFTHRKQNKKKFEKKIIRLKSINNLSSSSPQNNLIKKSLSINSSQLTNTDKAYLDKLVRTASDRSMWKRDYPLKKDQFNKLRKVPSGQIEEKI